MKFIFLSSTKKGLRVVTTTKLMEITKPYINKLVFVIFIKTTDNADFLRLAHVSRYYVTYLPIYICVPMDKLSCHH